MSTFNKYVSQNDKLAMEDVEDAVIAEEGDNLIHQELRDVPTEVTDVCAEFGKRVRKMQFDAAAYYVLHAEIKFEKSQLYWKNILQSLAQLASNETYYIQLPFIHKNCNSKKEIEARRHFNNSLESIQKLCNDAREGSVSHHILRQCVAYVNAKLRLLTVHRAFAAALESAASSEWESVLEEVKELGVSSNSFTHPSLSELHDGFVSECDLIRLVLIINASLRDLNMMESIVKLKEMREKLLFWKKELQAPVERKKSFFTGIRSHQSPFNKMMEKCGNNRLLAYFFLLHLWLLNKFSMYFSDGLSRFCAQGEFRNEEAEVNMNLGLSVSELVTELARKEKEIVFLLLVTTSLGQHPSRGIHYRRNRPEESHEPEEICTESSNRFPILYLHASDKNMFMEREYECVTRFVQDQLKESAPGSRAHLVEKDRTTEKPMTLMGECVEGVVQFVLILEGKRSEKEIAPSTCINNLLAFLRGSAVISKFR